MSNNEITKFNTSSQQQILSAVKTLGGLSGSHGQSHQTSLFERACQWLHLNEVSN